ALRRRARFGEPAGEQLAAVLGRQVGELERPELLGLADDLGLVPGEQRSQERKRSGALDDAEVLKRLARDLTERVAGDERLCPLPTRELCGDADHQPPLREHLQTACAGRRELTLRLAERDDEKPRPSLEAVEERDLRVRLVDRFRPSVRTAGEMDEV